MHLESYSCRTQKKKMSFCDFSQQHKKTRKNRFSLLDRCTLQMALYDMLIIDINQIQTSGKKEKKKHTHTSILGICIIYVDIIFSPYIYSYMRIPIPIYEYVFSANHISYSVVDYLYIHLLRWQKRKFTFSHFPPPFYSESFGARNKMIYGPRRYNNLLIHYQTHIGNETRNILSASYFVRDVYRFSSSK